MKFSQLPNVTPLRNCVSNKFLGNSPAAVLAPHCSRIFVMGIRPQKRRQLFGAAGRAECFLD